jgi:site-specific recombinase XerD
MSSLAVVLAPATTPDYAPLRELVLNAVSSPLSRAMYQRALDDFFAWREKGELPFSRATVQAHRAWLADEGYAPSSINQRLAAIRKLAKEAAANGWIPFDTAGAIDDVPGAKQSGIRMGNWLTKAETQKLLDAPPDNTLKGIRDRAVLALLVACALRRSELVALTVEHLQQREGRWVIADMIGKGGRVRTIPVPAGVKQRVDNWLAAAAIESGRILRSMNRHGRVTAESMSPNGVLKLVAEYSHVKPHDLRRTCAKLCRKSGGELEQVQLLLGHASIQTTERYLGSRQELENAPNDRLGLRFCD